MADRRITDLRSTNDSLLGINVGRRVDPRDAERLFEQLTSRIDQISADQNAALAAQSSLLNDSLRQQRQDARAGVRLNRQLLTAQRQGLRDQRQLQERASLIGRDQNRLLANFNANQRNQAMSDFLRNQGMSQFTLTQSLRELLS